MTASGSNRNPKMPGKMAGMIGLHRAMPDNGAMTTGIVTGGKKRLLKTSKLYLNLLQVQLVMTLPFVRPNRLNAWPRILLRRPLVLGPKHKKQHSSYARTKDSVVRHHPVAVSPTAAATACPVTARTADTLLFMAASSTARGKFRNYWMEADDLYYNYIYKGKSKSKAKGKKGYWLEGHASWKGKSKGKSKSSPHEGYRTVNAYNQELFAGAFELADSHELASTTASSW